MTDPVPSKELHFTWAWDASALNWRLSPIDMGDGLQAGYDHIAGYYERCLIDEIERLRRRVDELNAENDRWADLSNARDDAKLRASAEPSLDDRMHALAHDLMNAGRLEDAARLAQPPRDAQ